jgi:O-antigen ligase
MPIERSSAEAVGWAAVGLCAATFLGIATAVNPRAGTLFALALAALVSIALRPGLILPLLGASIFVEDLAVGGITISRILAPLALGVLLAAAMGRRLTIGATSPLRWIGAYTLWALASLAWTISTSDTVFQLSSLAIGLVYMIVAATLIDSRRELHRVLLAISFGSCAAGMIAFVEVVLHLSSGYKFGRPTGGAGDPNLFAAYQVCALPITLALIASTRSRSLRALLIAVVVVGIASIFASASRGGLLALATVLILIAVLPARTILGSRSQKMALLVTVFLTAGVLLSVTADPVVNRVVALQTTDPTGSGRVFVWKAAWISIKEHEPLGLGYGGFSAAVNELLRETPGIDFRHIAITPYSQGSGPHSIYIGSLAELGPVGLVLLLSLLLATVRHLIRTAKRARHAGAAFVGRVANALVLSLIGWSIASIFLSLETSRSLWILVGISLALPKLITHDRVGSPHGGDAGS